MVRPAGSGGRYAGRSSATRSLNTVIPRVHPTRSAITVAGIVGTTFSCARIASSNASTADPAGFRSYFGGPSEATAARTVFRETPNVPRNRLDRQPLRSMQPADLSPVLH